MIKKPPKDVGQVLFECGVRYMRERFPAEMKKIDRKINALLKKSDRRDCPGCKSAVKLKKAKKK
jgi:hypothetical protein